MRTARSLLVPALAVAVLLTGSGCSSDPSPSTASSAEPSPSSEGSSGEGLSEEGSPPPGADAGDSPDPEDGPVPLSEGVEYDDGVQVEVVETRAGRTSPTGVGAEETDGSVAVVTVRVTNDGDEPFDVSQLSMSATYGDGQPAEWVFDAEEGIDGFFSGELPPGESQEVVAGFAVPADQLDRVVVDVSPNDPDRARAVFEGAVG